jgi:hypothetical protein
MMFSCDCTPIVATYRSFGATEVCTTLPIEVKLFCRQVDTVRPVLGQFTGSVVRFCVRYVHTYTPWIQVTIDMHMDIYVSYYFKYIYSICKHAMTVGSCPESRQAQSINVRIPRAFVPSLRNDLPLHRSHSYIIDANNTVYLLRAT